MSNRNGTPSTSTSCLDYDVHGLVGVRLVNPTAGDAAAVARQLGPLRAQLTRPPDLVVRFVPHLATSGMQLLGLEKNGFTSEGFFLLRSSKGRAKVRIDFDQIGGPCEIVCESGLRAVPLLMAIINLTALRRDCVALHASAFVYDDTGVLVTGWAKGGKTEALLSFAAHGARYVGDEWILLRGDGSLMYGIPEHIRLWDWHLRYLPAVRRQVKRERRLVFKTIHALDHLQTHLPVKYLREAMPALRRQLNVTLAPQAIFGPRFGPLQAKPEKVFLLLSHELPHTEVKTCDPAAIARQMIASIQYELLPFMEHYHAFAFAFPERRNRFIEQMHEHQFALLCGALAGKEAYVVRHPYPFSFQELFGAMRPYCTRAADLRPVRQE